VFKQHKSIYFTTGMAKERNKSLHPRHAEKGMEVSVNAIPVPKPS
jgi:hypothetical protein